MTPIGQSFIYTSLSILLLTACSPLITESRTEQVRSMIIYCKPNQCFIIVDPRIGTGEVYKVWVDPKLWDELLINDRWEAELKRGKGDGFNIVKMRPVSVTKNPKK